MERGIEGGGGGGRGRGRGRGEEEVVVVVVVVIVEVENFMSDVAMKSNWDFLIIHFSHSIPVTIIKLIIYIYISEC